MCRHNMCIQNSVLGPLRTIQERPGEPRGHTHSFNRSGSGCQTLLSNWLNRSGLFGRCQGGPINTERRVWNHTLAGQWGATNSRQCLQSHTWHRFFRISVNGGKAYKITSGQSWANASRPRDSGLSIGENQRGQWEVWLSANTSTAAVPYVLHIIRLNVDSNLPVTPCHEREHLELITLSW